MAEELKYWVEMPDQRLYLKNSDGSHGPLFITRGRWQVLSFSYELLGLSELQANNARWEAIQWLKK